MKFIEAYDKKKPNDKLKRTSINDRFFDINNIQLKWNDGISFDISDINADDWVIMKKEWCLKSELKTLDNINYFSEYHVRKMIAEIKNKTIRQSDPYNDINSNKIFEIINETSGF